MNPGQRNAISQPSGNNISWFVGTERKEGLLQFARPKSKKESFSHEKKYEFAPHVGFL